MGHVYVDSKGRNYYYRFEYRDNEGVRHQKTFNTGVSKYGSKKKALELGREKEEAYFSELTKNEHNDINGNITLEDFGQYWLKRMEGSVKLSTLAEYKRTFNNRIVPLLGKKCIASLHQRDIENYIDRELALCDEIEAKDDGTRTFRFSIGKHYSLISQILDYAVGDDILCENPAKKIHKEYKNKIPQSSFACIPYNMDEVNKLIECAKGSVIEVPIMLALFLGLRRSEICGLRWCDILFDERVVCIRHTRTKEDGKDFKLSTKNKASKAFLPLTVKCEKYLRELQKRQAQDEKLWGAGYIKNDLICKNTLGEPIGLDYLSSKFKDLLEENGLRHITFHGLRHTVGTFVVEGTHDIYMTSKLLRHSQIGTTADIYCEADTEYKRKGFNKLDEIYQINEDS